MNLGRRYVASTVATRMQAAISDTRVLRSLPSPIANKVAVMRGKILPKALYAVATSPIPKGVLTRLVSVMATCVDPGAARAREPTLALRVAGQSCIDPRAHVLAVRTLALRRAWYITPHLREAMQH
eukprot:4164799-Alexandrium_andersonii.AAC.1